MWQVDCLLTDIHGWAMLLYFFLFNGWKTLVIGEGRSVAG